ncbi:MAG: cysteine rich repeat-containing protein [Burkholderiales bacterium]
MKLLHATTAVLLASTLFVLPVSAAEDGENACRADAAKLCKDVKPGGGRLLQCMKQHESELSAPCKERMAQGKKRAEEFKEACKSDAEKLCKDTPKGRGSVIGCLAKHKPELSSSCQQKITEAQKNHPCSKDAERLCKDVKPGKGLIAQCMKSHEKDLSPACKSSLQKRHAKATS